MEYEWDEAKRQNSEELKTMRQRRGSQTNWELLRKLDQAGTEPDLSDPDDAEITEAEFQEALRKRRRGPQKSPVKMPTNIRLSPEVVQFFKAGGRGWQTRLNRVLEEYVGEHS